MFNIIKNLCLDPLGKLKIAIQSAIFHNHHRFYYLLYCSFMNWTISEKFHFLHFTVSLLDCIFLMSDKTVHAVVWFFVKVNSISNELFSLISFICTLVLKSMPLVFFLQFLCPWYLIHKGERLSEKLVTCRLVQNCAVRFLNEL